MSSHTASETTALLADWAAGFRLQTHRLPARTRSRFPHASRCVSRTARVLVARVEHPRGSPHRRMTWDELQGLFRDTVSHVLTAERVAKVVDLLARLDGDARPRDITAAFIAKSGRDADRPGFRS